MSESYHVYCLSKTLSPITHMDRSEGNESLIAREPVMTPQGVRHVPRLSGNALRHRMVREPLARFLIERWGLEKKLSLRHANFLFHGGTLTESNARVDTAHIAEAYRLFPSVHLLGGCLPDTILPGSMAVQFGVLACRENAARIAPMLPPGIDVPNNLRPAEAFVSNYQYTRGDAAKKDITAQDAASGKADSSLMIFAGEAVSTGAVFVHGFVLQHVSLFDLGALLLGIQRWQANGATVGGMSARGHGVLDTLVTAGGAGGGEGTDGGVAVGAFVEHVDAVKDEATAWLESTFAARLEKPKKGGKRAAIESNRVA